MQSDLSYLQSVETRLCTGSKYEFLGVRHDEYGGIECYATTKLIDFGVMILGFGIATQQVPLPSWLIKYARGPLYNVQAYHTGLRIGAVMGAGGACYMGFMMAGVPVNTDIVAKQKAWRNKDSAERLKQVAWKAFAQIIARTFFEAGCYGFMAVISRYGIGQRLFSGLSGWMFAGSAIVSAAKIGVSLSGWNRTQEAQGMDIRTDLRLVAL